MSVGSDAVREKLLYKFTKCTFEEKYLWRYLKNIPKLGFGK